MAEAEKRTKVDLNGFTLLGVLLTEVDVLEIQTQSITHWPRILLRATKDARAQGDIHVHILCFVFSLVFPISVHVDQ